MIDPVVLTPAVILTAGLAVDPVMIALAPKFTLAPPLKVIAPDPLLTVDVIVKIPFTPPAVNVTVPEPLAVTGPLITIAPLAVARLILPLETE
jgi:hypothetical protein